MLVYVNPAYNWMSLGDLYFGSQVTLLCVYVNPSYNSYWMTLGDRYFESHVLSTVLSDASVFRFFKTGQKKKTPTHTKTKLTNQHEKQPHILFTKLAVKRNIWQTSLTKRMRTDLKPSAWSIMFSQ